METLTLAELRELETLHAELLWPVWARDNALRAIRELIALREQKATPGWNEALTGIGASVGTESGVARAIAGEYEIRALVACHERLRETAINFLYAVDSETSEDVEETRKVLLSVLSSQTPQAGVQ